MAAEPLSSPSNADTHIAPWASKWDALSEIPKTQPSSPPSRPVEAAPAPLAKADEKLAPPAAQGVFASKLMAGISAASFILLAALIVICWPDISRALG